MFLRRGTLARRKPGQALVLAEAGRLPTIYLGETKPKRELPQVYLCEAGQDGASHRLKWLASTCLAGMVGVCLIGFAVYASMNMSDGKGMVSSIKQASLAALKPMRSATLARDGQSATIEKGDRIQLTASGFTSRNVIHETVVEHQGSREYITIKPYLRIVAGLATTQPDDADTLPPFNPFKLYSDSTPVGSDGDATTPCDAPQADEHPRRRPCNGVLPEEDGVELKADEVDDSSPKPPKTSPMPDPQWRRRCDRLHPAAGGLSDGQWNGPSPLAPNLTMIHKTAEDQPYDNDDDLAECSMAARPGRSRSDAATRSSIIIKVGAERSRPRPSSRRWPPSSRRKI